MPSRREDHWVPVLCLGALLASLTFGGESLAQTEGGRPKGPDPARQQVKFKEAEALREAYILLAEAKKDYNGHKVKAMHQIQEAVKLLDRSVLRRGTAGQKATTLNEDSAAARAKVIAKHVQGVHELQAQSDAQLRAADQLLAQVRAALIEKKQKKPLSHVNNAIKDIAMALRVRWGCRPPHRPE
jgi:hypothetical protein